HQQGLGRGETRGCGRGDHVPLDDGCRGPQARDAIAAKADLLGAIRLPADAHQRAAGTRVITDILVLRRRLPGQAPAGQSWKTTVDLAEQDLNVDAPVWVNQYFLDNPDHVLG